MGERKVLNRYVPPDFDPSIIPKFKREKNREVEVRMMLPFSMRCSTCGEYMGRGKKFNCRKENPRGDHYMGIKKVRFILKCSVCSAEIAFKTDPKNSDYECEWGATRNFEVWRDNENAENEEVQLREQEDTDAMTALENRTLDSKREMDTLDALDEIKANNQRHEHVDMAVVLQRHGRDAHAADKAREDEELVKSIVFGRGSTATATPLAVLRGGEPKTAVAMTNKLIVKKKKAGGVKRTRQEDKDSEIARKEDKDGEIARKETVKETTTAGAPLSGLLGDYGDSD